MQESLHQTVLFLIDQVGKRSKRHAQRRMDQAGMGVTIDQWVLLKVLEDMGGGTQRELAERAVRDPASITRTLDLLEKKQLLERVQVEGDRRSYQVLLTKMGKAFIGEHMALIHQLREESVAGLTKKQVLQLRDGLARMAANFDD